MYLNWSCTLHSNISCYNVCINCPNFASFFIFHHFLPEYETRVKWWLLFSNFIIAHTVNVCCIVELSWCALYMMALKNFFFTTDIISIPILSSNAKISSYIFLPFHHHHHQENCHSHWQYPLLFEKGNPSGGFARYIWSSHVRVHQNCCVPARLSYSSKNLLLLVMLQIQINSWSQGSYATPLWWYLVLVWKNTVLVSLFDGLRNILSRMLLMRKILNNVVTSEAAFFGNSTIFVEIP